MNIIRQISDSELEIMRVIWKAKDSAMFVQIMSDLNEKDSEFNLIVARGCYAMVALINTKRSSYPRGERFVFR